LNCYHVSFACIDLYREIVAFACRRFQATPAMTGSPFASHANLLPAETPLTGKLIPRAPTAREKQLR
jgi:hypothetical protein